MSSISIQQLLAIAAIVVLLFGTKKLGSIDSDLGASIKGFKKAMGDDESKQDKTNQDADFTARSITDKQGEVKKKDVESQDGEQVQSMFDIGFSELLLVFVIGLIVLGSQRSPVAVKTVAGWVRALRSLAATVQNELAQELKLQEFQDSLKKVEKASLTNLTPELKASVNELREVAESMKRPYSVYDPEKASDEAHIIHNPVVKEGEVQREGVTPAAAENQASPLEQKPEPAGAKTPEQTENTSAMLTDAEKKAAAPVVKSSPSSSDKP